MQQPYYRPKVLLGTNNKKTMKGEKLGYKTYILYMSPFTANSKKINVCPHASNGCAEACLVGSGFGGMYKAVGEGRRNKTEYFLANRTEFLAQLDAEIATVIRKNEGQAIVTIRLNGTSDIRYEKFIVRDGKNIFDLYPNIQFYDYTKNHLRFDIALPKNYHLTFSRSENNGDKAMELLKRGFNVAMVFDKVPSEYGGYKVINGDENDLRFLDKKNVIVGLKYKKNTGSGGTQKNITAIKSGFVISTKAIALPREKKVKYKKAA